MKFKLYFEKQLKYETDLFSLLFYDKANGISIKDIYVPIDEKIFREINEKRNIFFHITDKKGLEYLKKSQNKSRNPVSCFRNLNEDIIFKEGISDSVKPEYIIVLEGQSLFSSTKDMISIPSYRGIRRLISLNNIFPEEENKLYRKFIKFRNSLLINKNNNIINKGRLIFKVFNFWNNIITDRFDYIKKTVENSIKKSDLYEIYDEHLIINYKLLNSFKIKEYPLNELKVILKNYLK